MEAVETKVVISLDASFFEKKIESLQASVVKFEKLLAKAGDTDFGKKLAKIIPGLKSQIDALASSAERTTQANNKLASSEERLSKTTAQANFALINTGRVIQDIPFGMYAIANNIEPLVTSFAYLSKATKDSGGAFSALIGSLKGTGGLILLASLASVAMTVFGDRIFKTGGQADESKKKIDDLSKSLKGIENIKLDAFAENQGDITKANALIDILNNTNKSYAERKRALEKLKEINKDYFGDLTVESASYQTLKQRVDELSKSLISQAVIKGYQDEITTLTKLQNEYQRKYDSQLRDIRQQEELAKIEKDRQKLLKGFSAVAAGTSPLTFGVDDRSEKLDKLRKVASATNTDLEKTSFSIVDLNNKIQNEVENLIKLPTYGGEDSSKKIKTAKDLILELYKIRLEGNEKIAALEAKNADDELTRINELNYKKLLENRKYYQDRINDINSSEDWTDKEKKKIVDLYEYFENLSNTKIQLNADIELSEASFSNAAIKIESKGTELAKRLTKGYEAGLLPLKVPKIEDIPQFGDNPAGDPKLYEDYIKKENKAIEILKKARLSLSDIKGFKLFGDQEENAKAVDKFLENFKRIEPQIKRTSEAIANTLTPVFEQFFQSLIDGSKKPFEALKQSIKSLIVQLSALIVKALITKAVTAFLGPAGAGAAAAGKGFLQGFSDVFGGMGVAGPINTGTILGSAVPVNQSLVAEVRGSSLAFILNKNSNSKGRLG